MAENKRDDSYIVVKDLNKYFYDTPEPMKILEDISFTVKKGEMVCLVGSSGCGKSTLLRAISGLDPSHEGTVTVDGKEIVKPEKERGMVFRSTACFPG